MGVWSFQTAFTRGELDPRLAGRIDIQAYYSGLETASEVLCIPQGGIQRRPGTVYLGSALGSDGRLEKFSFNTSIEYLLVFTYLKMQVYKNGVLIVEPGGVSGQDYVVTPWDTSDIASFDFIQSADVGIVTVKELAPHQIERFADDDWRVTSLVGRLVNIPKHNFNDSSSPTPVSEIQTITFTNHNEGDRYKLGLNGILTEEIVFAGDDAANVELIKNSLQDLPSTSNSGVSVTASTSLTTYIIAFLGDSANDWELITGTPILSKDITFEINTARTQAGTSKKENVWSVGRGWPSKCTFHEGRLWFAGSLSRPSTIWGSNVNDFFNFKQTRGRDDEAVVATLDTDQLNEITGIFSNRSLQVFTSGQEFYIKASPITPTNVAVQAQTNYGSKPVRPVTIDGGTLYVQRNGKSVNQFAYIEAIQANQSISVTSLSPHLIKDPKKLAIKIGNSESEANYVYILNDYGDLIVLNTLLSEDVQAFTRWTDGRGISEDRRGIISIAVVNGKLHTLVNRVVNGSVVYYICVEDNTVTTDSAKISGATTGNYITGLSHLEGETVQVKADSAYMGEFTVSGGQVELTRSASSTEVGYSFTPVIKTMPLNIGLDNGPNAAKKKRIIKAAINYYKSNGIIVNNQVISDKVIGEDQFDAPIPKTDTTKVSLFGWSTKAQIEITQSTPMPMTILSLGIEVAT